MLHSVYSQQLSCARIFMSSVPESRPLCFVHVAGQQGCTWIPEIKLPVDEGKLAVQPDCWPTYMGIFLLLLLGSICFTV